MLMFRDNVASSQLLGKHVNFAAQHYQFSFDRLHFRPRQQLLNFLLRLAFLNKSYKIMVESS